MRLVLATMMIARIATAFRSSATNGGVASRAAAFNSAARHHHRAAFGVAAPSQLSTNGSNNRPWLNTRRHMSDTLEETKESTEEAEAPTGYPFATVEKKWQAYWKENNTFATPDRRTTLEDGTVVKSKNKKKYVLDMFPYPSGAGLHVGHPEGYTGEYSSNRWQVLMHP